MPKQSPNLPFLVSDDGRRIVGLVHPDGTESGFDGIDDVSSAQETMTGGGTGHLSQPGTYIATRTIYFDNNSSLEIGAGVELRRGDGVNAPLFMNRQCAYLLRADAFSRSSNVVTVKNRWHSRFVGESVLIKDSLDTSYNGQVTVTSVTTHTWTYASTGTNGTMSSTRLPAVVPATRTINGASFARTSNVVVVTDPATDLRPGDLVYVGTAGAATTYTGVVEVMRVIPGVSWAYFLSGADGTATGSTMLINYQRNIRIFGAGYVNGNRANNARSNDTNVYSAEIMNCVGVFGLVNGLTVEDVSMAGSDGRLISPFNCSDALIRNIGVADVQAAVQFEGGGRKCRVHGLRGSSATWVSAPQKTDDCCAFTLTAYNAANPAGYNDTVTPYEFCGFDPIEAFDVFVEHALNGIKIAGHSTGGGFDRFHVRNVVGGAKDPSYQSASTAGVRFQEDGTGLTGGTMRHLIVENVNWTDRQGQNNTRNVWLNGVTGGALSVGTLEISGTDDNCGVQLETNYVTVERVEHNAVEWASTAVANRHGWRFGVGTNIRHWNLRNAKLQPGTNSSSSMGVYIDIAATVNMITVEDSELLHWTSTNGVLVDMLGTVDSIVLRRVRTPSGQIPGAIVLARKAGATTKVVLEDCDITSYFVGYDLATASLNPNMTWEFRGGKWTNGAAAGRVLGFTGSSPGTHTVIADVGASIPAAKIVPSTVPAGIALRYVGMGLQDDIAATGLNAAMTAQQIGDVMYNTNAAAGTLAAAGAIIKAASGWKRADDFTKAYP